MQLIVFEPDGSIEYTRNPLVDAMFDGERKSVTRMSEIIFEEEQQQFYIRLLTGKYRGVNLCWHVPTWVDGYEKELRDLFNMFLREHTPCIVFTASSECSYVLLETYELAVEMEVAFVTFLREQGYSMQ